MIDLETQKTASTHLWRSRENGQTVRPEISIVIPTYGRGKVLGRHVDHIRDILRAHFEEKTTFEIILVDDHSPDGSAEVIRRLAARYPEIRGILLAYNAGQQNATLAGLRLASGDSVITMDDDLKDNPNEIPRLLEALRHDVDVVYGVPDCPIHASNLRRWGTKGKDYLIARLSGRPVDMRLTGFRAIRRTTVDRICLETRSQVYISATILQEPVRIGQLPVQGRHESAQASGYTLLRLLRVFAQLAFQYGRSPLLRPFKRIGEQYEILEVVG